jgi:hypothetical protein
MNNSKTQESHIGISGLTLRKDLWWIQPLAAALVFGIFIIYATWAAFCGTGYEFENYHSPFSWPIHPSWWPLSPALLFLWIPLGFRATCYFVRRVYYRSFFWDPPACAVGESRKSYHGETRFPFILQNLHRYFFYLTLVELCVIWFDVTRSFIFEESFGIGIGSLVLLLNGTLLSLYTFSCHAFRHLAGGKTDCFSACPKQHLLWKKVTFLNEHHGLWMWVSLFWVGFTDLYVRLLSMGIIHDVRFF